MKKINLRELYPDVYTTDFLVDVTEEVMETIRAAERVLYYRTRIKDANGKLVAIYAKTPEELYNKETLALEQIENATFHRKTPTVADFARRIWKCTVRYCSMSWYYPTSSLSIAPRLMKRHEIAWS